MLIDISAFLLQHFLSGSYLSFNTKVAVRLSHKFYGKTNSFPWKNLEETFSDDVRVLGLVGVFFLFVWVFFDVLFGFGWLGFLAMVVSLCL